MLEEIVTNYCRDFAQRSRRLGRKSVRTNYAKGVVTWTGGKLIVKVSSDGRTRLSWTPST
jgi:hypothetical protein